MPVSREQALEVMAKLATNVNWEELDPDVLQKRIVDDSARAGRELTRFLQNGGRVQIVSLGGVIAPKGGKIHVVRVPVDESRSWEEAVRAAGPNTDQSWDVWKMGSEYPPQVAAKPKDEEVILVNFGKRVFSEEVIAYGKEQNLCPRSPRACLAVGEHCPNLHKDLGLNEMAVVSLVPCFFEGKRRVVYSWWGWSEREADLFWFVDDWGPVGWFAFSRE